MFCLNILHSFTLILHLNKYLLRTDQPRGGLKEFDVSEEINEKIDFVMK